MLFNSYLVIYTTKDQCNGYAIIHAKNPKEAGQMLIHQGMYRDKTYEIVSITQRHCPPENDSIIAQGITTVGLNAYELAVQQGYLGTLDQWLQSLIGPQGIQGPKGDKGDKGEDANVEDCNEAIAATYEALEKLSSAADNANNAAVLADKATKDTIAAKDNAISATNECAKIISEALIAINNTEEATQQANTSISNVNTVIQNTKDATADAKAMITQGQQVIKQMSDTTTLVQEKLANGDFIGAEGYTPIKGTDYFTQEEINSIIEQANVPTLVSQLENDVPYLNPDSLNSYYTKSEVNAMLTWD